MGALSNALGRGGARLQLDRFSPSRIARVVLWVVALAFVVEGYNRHTPSNDEWVQHTYGELLWDFWLSGTTDKTFLSFSNLYLYGGLFDLIAAAGTRAFGWEWWPWRHLLTATFGLLALWGTARLARVAAPRVCGCAGDYRVCLAVERHGLGPPLAGAHQILPFRVRYLYLGRRGAPTQ